MRLLNFQFITILLFGMQASGAHLLQSVWSCSIPCIAKKGAEYQIYEMLDIGYCGTDALSEEMFVNVTPECVRASGNPGAQAVRATPDGVALLARCTSSGNPCTQKGIIPIAFNCAVSCPTDALYTRRASVCATSDASAWEEAAKICPGAEKPSMIPQSQVCQGIGQTPC